MKKILLFLALFPAMAWGQQIINLDKTYIDSTWTSIEVDTLFFDRDSVYITADGDTMIFVVDDVTGMYIASDGSNASVVITDTLKILDLASANTLVLTPTSTGNVDTLETTDLATADITVTGDWDFVNADVDTLIVNDTLYVGGNSMFDSTVSIGSWGYTGEHITIPEISSNTNAALGVYSMIDYAATAGKVFAGTYSRALAMTANQANQSTIVGTESQFRLRDVDIADGVHAGLWAYAEQSGTSELSGGGTFDAISATVGSDAGFTVGATEHVTGITIDASINAKATIDASANYSGIYIKSNGLDWFDGIKITGATNAIELQSAATIDNTETDTLTLTETVVKVDGELAVTGAVMVTSMAASGIITGEPLIALHTVATYTFFDADSCRGSVHINNDANPMDFTLLPAQLGLVQGFYDRGGAVITIDVADGTDSIELNGTSVGAGDAIDSPGAAGDFIWLMAIDANTWISLGRKGDWIDGGTD